MDNVSKDFLVTITIKEKSLFAIVDYYHPWKPKKGLILHSDLGTQFASWEFVSYCKEKKGIQNMSKAECLNDNAPMERFYNTLKNELIYPNHFYTKSALDEALRRYVFVW